MDYNSNVFDAKTCKSSFKIVTKGQLQHIYATKQDELTFRQFRCVCGSHLSFNNYFIFLQQLVFVS